MADSRSRTLLEFWSAGAGVSCRDGGLELLDTRSTGDDTDPAGDEADNDDEAGSLVSLSPALEAATGVSCVDHCHCIPEQCRLRSPGPGSD